MPLLEIFFLSFIVLVWSFFLFKNKKLIFSKKDFFILSVGSLFFTLFSFYISWPRACGSVSCRNHGWPHFFYIFKEKDLLDGLEIMNGDFIFGPLGLYIFSDFVFYFSLLFFAYVFLKKDNRIKEKK